MNPILFLPFFLSAQAPEPVESSIRSEDLRGHIYFLASEELAGRDSGSPGESFASRYLADALISYGVKPAGADGSFFQPFEMGDRQMRNVAGWIEGTDSERKQEMVILGAHFDHVGMGGETQSLAGKTAIHNGADDNASGSASLLELAQAFALSPPKRSILFLFFSGEEHGLWGSAHYCDEPLFPLERAVAMLNLDMVGRSRENYLFVGGTGTGSSFPAILKEQAASFSFRLETKSGGMAPSDNSNFYTKDIPVLFFFTNVHEDYHAPGDDWWKINYAGQEAITRYVFRVTKDLANRADRPEFEDDPGMAVPDDFGKRMMELMSKSGRIPQKAKPKKKKTGG